MFTDSNFHSPLSDIARFVRPLTQPPTPNSNPNKNNQIPWPPEWRRSVLHMMDVNALRHERRSLARTIGGGGGIGSNGNGNGGFSQCPSRLMLQHLPPLRMAVDGALHTVNGGSSSSSSSSSASASSNGNAASVTVKPNTVNPFGDARHAEMAARNEIYDAGSLHGFGLLLSPVCAINVTVTGTAVVVSNTMYDCVRV